MNMLKERLQEALNRGGTHTLDDVTALLKSGKAQWHSNGNGCIVTEIENFPLVKAVRFWLIAGDLDACAELAPSVEQWAIREGCTVGLATGRPGWAKVVPALGWEPRGMEWKKSLTGGSFGRR